MRHGEINRAAIKPKPYTVLVTVTEQDEIGEDFSRPINLECHPGFWWIREQPTPYARLALATPADYQAELYAINRAT